jgi:hypothetical protein
MRSIQAAPAARILRVSRILHGNGTLTHYRGLRDDGMRGHRGRGNTYDPSAPRAPSAGADVPRAPRLGAATGTSAASVTFSRWIHAPRLMGGAGIPLNDRQARIHRGNRRASPPGVALVVSCGDCDGQGGAL